MGILQSFVGDPSNAFVKKHQKTIRQINELEPDFEKLTDKQLREKTDELRTIVQEKLREENEDPLAILDVKNRQHEKRRITAVLDSVLVEAFALVRESAKRTVGQRPFDVQLMGGIALHQGNIAEMRTGEGKTLVATLPLYLNALTGRGAHLVTVNDYLAKLAVEWYGPVYNLLGLSVGVIVHDTQFCYVADPDKAEGHINEEHPHLMTITRREAYACDITYGTNNEFGFDYLRDNMAPDAEYMVQRPLFYGIVDEVDSILIDEARTPLIISGPAEESADLYVQFSKLVPRLKKEVDYTVDEKDKVVSLTRDGIDKMEKWLGVDNIYASQEVQLAYHLEEALKAHILFKLDKDYVVREGEVIIVDEFTGRLMPGRRYSEGLHQAIEAKEGVSVQRESVTLATISFQNLFRLYVKLAGMTGTAKTEAEEFQKIYDLDVIVIPTNKPMIRKDLPDRIFKSEKGKIQAIIREVKERHGAGQPVLIGTISIEKNERLGDMLKRNGIPFEILNAKNHEREALIIAQAGRKGAVTLATNMAGRGTDIMLGGRQPNKEDYEDSKEYEKALEAWKKEHQEVLDLGGLCVIGTERHESRRIDNQLRGRAGRQGDPGVSVFYVSADDDLLRVFGGDRIKKWLEVMGLPDDEAIEHKMLSRSLESAQKRVEGFNFDSRKYVVQYDDVMNRHREVMYRKRAKVLMQKEDFTELDTMLHEALEGEARRMAGAYASGYHAEWNLDQLTQDVAILIGLSPDDRKTLMEELGQYQSDTAIEQRLTEILGNVLDQKRTQFGELYGPAVRSILLQTIDMLWIEHLNTMKELQTGIRLQSYAQNDPLVAYKSRGYQLFQQLLHAIENQTLRTVFRIERVEMTRPA